MTTVSRRRIRLKIDYALKTTYRVKDVYTALNPEIWKNNDIQIELGLFYNNTILDDISTIATLTITVRNGSAAGAVLLTKTITTGDLVNCSADDWSSGASQHALIALTNAETDIAAGTHWLVVSVTTTDSPSCSVTLGATQFTVTDGGATP